MIKTNTNFWYTVGIFVITLSAWIIYKDAIFHRLTLLIGLIIISCFIWALFSVIGIDVERSAKNPRQKVGDYFEERFTITNKLSFWHFNLLVEDYSKLEGQLNSRIISYLGPKQVRTFNTFTLLTKRGSTSLGPTVIKSCDPLNLFNARKENNKCMPLLIYPYLVELIKFPEPPGLLTGGKSLKKASMDTMPHAAGIREYSAGDPLKRIHWPSTLRKNKFMVKEFDQDPQSSIWIFLDSHFQMHYKNEITSNKLINPLEWAFRKKNLYSLPQDTYEYAISIAASIANYYIKQERLTGFSAAGKVITHLSAEKGFRQLAKILETLAFLQPDGDLRLLGLIQAEAKNLSKGTTIILISTSAEKEIELCAESIRQRGLIPILIILDIHSFLEIDNTRNNPENMPELKSNNIMVKYGDDIKNRLESIQFP